MGDEFRYIFWLLPWHIQTLSSMLSYLVRIYIYICVIWASLSEPHTSSETGRIFYIYWYSYLSYVRRPVYIRVF